MLFIKLGNDKNYMKKYINWDACLDTFTASTDGFVLAIGNLKVSNLWNMTEYLERDMLHISLCQPLHYLNKLGADCFSTLLTTF